MKAAWRLLQLLWRAKKLWRAPGPADVVILDGAGQEFLRDYLRPWRVETLYVRGEQLNIPVLLASLTRRGDRSQAYVDEFIERVRPRLVVTFIDNSMAFFALSGRHPECTTLFVQNGFRGYFADVFELLEGRSTTADLRVDYMMTFGRRIAAEYRRYLSGTVVPMGSLRNNQVLRKATVIPGTIAFASQYRPTDGITLGATRYSFDEFFRKADRLILEFLADYAQRYAKSLVIVPCFGGDPRVLAQEKAYYEELLGEGCRFSEWHGPGSSYEAADASEVFVTIDSTIGYEAAARGNRTAFFTVRSELLGVPGMTYGWPGRHPDTGPFWSNRADRVAFTAVLDYLFSIDDDRWRSGLREHDFTQQMIYDPDNSILTTTLRQIIGAPRPPGLALSASHV